MAYKQKKPMKNRNPLSFLFRKAPQKPANTIVLQTKKVDSIKNGSKITEAEFELLNKYFLTESIVTSLNSLENIVNLRDNHIKRLSREKSCISDIEDMTIVSGDSIILGLLKRWGKWINYSIENLDETLESLYTENVEPTACFHLNRSIVHLVNLYETICEISKLSPQMYDTTMYDYLDILAKCITDFRVDFTKYCSEISNYIAEFKQTLTLMINRHPENRLVIHAIGDIEKLYNCFSEITNKITTSTPVELEVSICYINRISNDINDIKSDLINVKHHQDKDKKYVNSSYV